jgi:hypothetical protein
MLAAAAVVLALAAAGAGFVFAQAGAQRLAASVPARPHPGGQRPTPGSTRSAAAMPAGSAGPAGSPGSGSSPGSGEPTKPGGRAGGTAPAGASARPAVAIASRARARPHAAAVLAFLTRYFTAINHHDYRAYLHLFSPASRRALSAAGFEAGYGTTRDSAERLARLKAAGPGQVAARVAFTSHQAPDATPAYPGCLHWRITVYLVRHDGRYVIGNPPAGYSATNRSC